MSSTMSTPLFEALQWTYDNIYKNITPEIVTDVALHGPEYYLNWWINLVQEHPHHVFIETGLTCFIIWLMFIKKTVDPSKPSRQKLTAKEQDWLIETWQPEPLVAAPSDESEESKQLIVEAVDGNFMNVRGFKKPILNLANYDFLGLGQDPIVEEKAREALEKYGCGSCGPRGFYGTLDVHLDFEKALAKFMKVEEAICYSDGASAVSSTVAAYSKKGDLLLVDEGCSEAIRTGVNLSRSTVQYFRHNDMNHLQSILEAVAKDDKKYKRDTTQQRRFIVVEGLYRNCGDVCPLPELLRLKEKHCYRVMLDESYSFGTIGATGRGITEHFGIDIKRVEIMTVSMDCSLASIGGACIGSRDVVDHQRLSGAGYCFSASAPPYLFKASSTTLHLLDSDTGVNQIEYLRENTKVLIDGLADMKHVHLMSNDAAPQINAPLAPIIHLVLNEKRASFEEEQAIFEEMSVVCMEHGVGVTVSKYIPKLLRDLKANHSNLRASLRIIVTATLTNAQIKKIAKEVKAAASKVLGK